VGEASPERCDPKLGLPVLRNVDAEAGIAPATPAVEPGEALAQGLGRGILHLGHHRGTNPQPPGVDAVRAILGGLAEAAHQVAADLLHEIAALVAELGTG